MDIPSDQRNDHDLFRTELTNLIDHRHELVKLASLIDWQAFADKWAALFGQRVLAGCLH